MDARMREKLDMARSHWIEARNSLQSSVSALDWICEYADDSMATLRLRSRLNIALAEISELVDDEDEESE